MGSDRLPKRAYKTIGYQIRHSHHVPLNSLALKVLKGLKNDSKWVFPSPVDKKNHLDPLAFYRKKFKPALKRAEIHGVVWHTLRHTFVSRLIMAGVDLKSVQKLIGHKTIEMTLRYSHLAPDHLKEAVAKLTQKR